MKSTFLVSEAQAGLSSIVNSAEIVGIRNRSKLRGYYVPRERLEGLLESMELLANAACRDAIAKFQQGRMKFHAWKSVKRELEEAAK